LDRQDAVCGAACPSGFFGKGHPLAEGRTCWTCDSCRPDQWEAVACSTAQNRQCSNCTLCDLALEWEERDCTKTEDRVCRNVTTCTATQWMVQERTSTSDRKCADLTQCAATQHETVAATATSDRTCTTTTLCFLGVTYETRAPNATADRDCAPVTKCDTDKEYTHAAATITSDNDCRNCTACSLDHEFPARGCNGVIDTQCEPIDRCIGITCDHGGTCKNDGGYTWACDCIPPYGGPTCGVNLTECDPSPCENDGTCTPKLVGFSCACKGFFAGARCQIDASSCDGNPCSQGDCVPESGGGIRCECTGNGCGELCDQILVDDVCQVLLSSGARSEQCAALGCQNGAVCVSDGAGGQVCSCSDGFCGPTCVGTLKGNSCVAASAAASVGAAAGGAVAGICLIAIVMKGVQLYRQQQQQKLLQSLPRVKPDEWEIERAHLTIGKTIGGGAFGIVSKALFQDPKLGEGAPATDVAVKMLKAKEAGPTDIEEFFSEMTLMKAIGRHRNVLSLVGVCTMDPPTLLVVEFADHGDLKGYMRDRRATRTRPAMLQYQDLIGFGAQVASGMEFLASVKVIHRDLAARNVLVCAKNVMKVADFGLARDVYEDDVYLKTSTGKMPFKWMVRSCSLTPCSAIISPTLLIPVACRSHGSC